MNIKELFRNKRFIFTYVFLSCSALATLFRNYINAELDFFILLFMSFIFAMAVTIANITKNKSAVYLGFGFLLVFVCIQGFLFDVNLFTSLNWLFTSRDILNENSYVYSLIAITAGLMFSSFLLFVLMSYKYVRRALCIILAALFTVLGVFEFSADNTTVFILMTLFAMSILEFFIKAEKAMNYLLPFIALIGFLSAFLPSNDEPMRWSPITSAVNQISKAVSNIADDIFYELGFTDSEFGIKMTGYSGDGRLLGALNNSKREQLKLSLGYNYANSVYLVGSIKDTFDGREWSREYNSDTWEHNEHILDYTELVLALYNSGMLSDKEKTGEFAVIRSVSLEYTGLKTQTAFYSPKTFTVSLDNPANVKGNSFYFSKREGEGTSYSLEYLDINYKNEDIVNLLNTGAVYHENIFDSNDMKAIKTSFSQFYDIPKNIYEILEKRKNEIYDVYTGISDDDYIAVYETASRITDDCVSNYDKMKKLEEYLNGFAYTLKPSKMPDSDFLHWFLNEEKQGYCTYFATALAVMGRSLGIPTRYVQGYAVTITSNNMSVKGNNAHAWVEAYIDGIGWIGFEPSPTFEKSRYTPWRNLNNKDIGEKPTDIVISQPEIPSGGTNGIIQPDNNIENTKDNYSLLITVLIFLFLSFTIAVICYILSEKHIKKAYLRMSANERFIADFRLIMRLLSELGYKTLSGETLRAFFGRLDCSEIKEDELKSLIAFHEIVFYNEIQISDAELVKTVELKERLERAVIPKIGKIRYMIIKLKAN